MKVALSRCGGWAVMEGHRQGDTHPWLGRPVLWSAGGAAWSSKVGSKCRSTSSGTVLRGGRRDNEEEEKEEDLGFT